MARAPRDREDLLAEATALVQRVELTLPDYADHVIAGFRRDGCGSVYFGPDEAYQFNSAGELRLAHLAGLLYKAQRGRLVSLQRRRESVQVVLLRHELDEDETEQFMKRMQSQVDGLQAALEQEAARVVGQVPADADVLSRVRDWLAGSPLGAIAKSPHAR